MEDQETADIELFQKNVADRFSDLLSPHSPDPSVPFLSIAWLRKLLDVFLCCEAEFKAIMIMGRDPSHLVKPPLDRLIPELLDRAIKSLDICNAVMHGTESMQHCEKLAEVAVVALSQRPLLDGQVRRAKNALSTLITLMTLEDKETGTFRFTERSWSFGLRGGSGTNKHRAFAQQFKSTSWSVSKTWSASKQIHAMTSNLVAPRGAEAAGTALPVYIMSTVMVFVMWALAAALPCKERNGLPSHFPVPKQFGWAQPIIGLHEKIGEEWRKKEKKGSAGLLDEMQRMEKSGVPLIDFAESFQFPTDKDKLEEVTTHVAELAVTRRSMEQGLMSLQQQIREVFHRILRTRQEFLDVMETEP